MKTGILLINLGTPAAPRTPEVRRYLRQFLTDGRVIDLPTLPRLALVHGIIAPFRAPRSAAAPVAEVSVSVGTGVGVAAAAAAAAAAGAC